MHASDDGVLRVDGLHKLYARRSGVARARARRQIGPALVGGPPEPVAALRSHEFWALNDISFGLNRGEALGVIGLNGSGKTTLLRVLAGQMFPDRGEVWIKGETASMIDLTAGLQLGASGRENIFLRGAALGWSRERIASLVDTIIAFSELGDAIDAPMATYSAGMKMRLAFSVITNIDPDILLVDEVLAVGDFLFRQKCLAKIREMRARSAFVLVSHSMSDISRFCDRVLVLHRGQLAYAGLPDDAIAYYQALEQKSPPVRDQSPSARIQSVTPVRESIVETETWAPIPVSLVYYLPTPFLDTTAVDDITASINGHASDDIKLEFGAPLKLAVVAKILRPCRRVIAGITILTEHGEGVSGIASDSQQKWLTVEGDQKVILQISIDNISLNPGRYTLFFNMRDGMELLYRNKICALEVLAPAHTIFGMLTIPHRWELGFVDQGRP